MSAEEEEDDYDDDDYYDDDDEDNFHSPTCDLCGRPDTWSLFDDADWNGETGSHLSCEQSKYEEILKAAATEAL